MMNKKASLVLIIAALSFSSFNAMAAPGECAAQVVSKLASNASYKALNAKLAPKVASLTTLLRAVKDQPTYAKLLSAVRAAAGTDRLVVTLADGTVVVDTGRSALNNYATYAAKGVNENHNSRVAIMLAQTHVCGLGVETKYSSTDKSNEKYVAIRLGTYLDSAVTARISRK
jgi:opacity protein-like surface antigen